MSFLDIVVLLTEPTPIVYIHTTGMAHFRIGNQVLVDTTFGLT